MFVGKEGRLNRKFWLTPGGVESGFRVGFLHLSHHHQSPGGVNRMNKRKLFWASLECFLAVVILMVVSCSPSSKTSGSQSAPAASASTDCLVGTYTVVKGGKTMSFTFKSDHTGSEVYSPTDIRELTWTQNGNKVHIIYPAHGDYGKTEWDIQVDCGANKLSVFGLVYKK
jgi:hypothetical protein